MNNFCKNLIKITTVFAMGILFIAPVGAGIENASTTARAEMEDAKQFRTVRASHILVETEDEAWALKSRITEGESFEKLAKEYSKCPSKEKGGDLGYFNRGQMVPEFEYMAFSTPIGEVSDPVKTRFGWHLIKVTRKMPLR